MKCLHCGEKNSPLDLICAKCGSESTFQVTNDNQTTENPSHAFHIQTENTEIPGLNENFEIVKQVGAGGMGMVYLAQDHLLNRKVAIKLLNSQLFDAKAKANIVHEARLSSNLNHKNIATVFDVSRSSETPYLIMEWVQGDTLDVHLARNDVSFLSKLNIARQIASGIAHAHDYQIIHRDLKPKNIILDPTDESIKILDFGIAEKQDSVSDDDITLQFKVDQKVSDKTLMSNLKGTISYMSPEQCRSRKLTIQSDIFSFGIILFELFCNKHPFKSDSANETIKNICHKPIDEKALSKLPRKLKRLILNCLEKETNNRPRSVQMIENELNSMFNESFNNAKKNKAYWLSSWRLTAIVFSAALLSAGIGYFVIEKPTMNREEFLSQGKKLAILPFENLSADPLIDVFANGLATGLSNELSNIGEHNSGAWVIPASEFRKFKSPSTKDIYNTYNVDFVISGSIQHFGEKRRLNIQLLNAKDSRILNSMNFDFSLEETFEIQETIRNQVLKLLSWTLPSSVTNSDIPISKAFNHYLMGIGYLYRFDYQNNLMSSVNELSKAIELDPSFMLASVELTRAYIRLARYESNNQDWLQKGFELINELLKFHDTSTNHSLLGEILFLKSDYSGSELHFLKSIELDPLNSDAYFGSGQLYQKISENEKAEEAFLKSLEISENWITWNYLAYFYYQTHQLEKARQAYEHMIKMTPNNVFGFQMLGAILLSENNYTDAQSVFERSVDLQPKNPYNWSNLGSIYFYQKQYKQAVDYFQKAVELNDSSFVLWANLGDAQRWSSQINESINSYKTATELISKELLSKPNNNKLRIKKASYLAKSENIDLALSLISSEKHSNDTTQLILLAQIYEISNDRSKSINYLRLAIKNGYPINSIINEPEFKNLLASDEASKLNLHD